MGSESPVERGVDDALAAADQAIVRSRGALQAMDQILRTQRQMLGTADAALARADEVLRHTHIDLTVSEQTNTARPGGRLRILVVDDSLPIRQLLPILFGAEFGDDVEVRVVASGEEALDLDWPADVIVLDWHMPGGIDGLETAARLRSQRCEARIVLYSAQPIAAGAGPAIAAGADLYLEKGSDTAALLAEVDTRLRKLASSSLTGD
jgi:CheY-like chemotaxis protein